MPHRGGRPRIRVVRREEDYPPGHPLDTPCRLWQGATDRDGYGILTGNNLANKRQYAHRWVWEMAYGPIVKGLVVRHLCDNPPCFRLGHLELGTVAQNNDDARRHHHLGPTPKLRPSEFELLFDLRDQGWTYERIWKEHFRDICSPSLLRKIGKHGRENFDEDWQRVLPPDPLDKYRDWRNR